MLVSSLVVLCLSGPAGASEFWDQVRTPGLRVYRATVRQGEQALDAGDTTAALEAASQAIGRLGQRPEGHRLRGLALTALGEHAQAASAYRAGLALDPTSLDAVEVGGLAAGSAARAGDFSLAATILARVLAHMDGGPERSRLYALRGDVLQALGPEQLHEAILCYRRAINSDGRGISQRAVLGLALAMDRSGDRGEAKRLAGSLGTGRPAAHGLARLPMTVSERAARRAIALSIVGKMAGASRAWGVVASMEGPWRSHARAALERTTW